MPTPRLDPIWKALADPTRRRILDALRSRPRTTGELCRPIRLSRYAVMKHLGVLERAGLVLVRRKGRERWNHLNAVPIQQIHERWVQPYEAHWARSLLHLRDHAEQHGGEAPMSTTHHGTGRYGVETVELEIVIAAKPERVWQAMVGETSAWWSKDFYTSAAAKGFHIEPRLGGRAYEDWGGGAGQVWYTVIGLDAPRMLTLHGLITPEFGGPTQTLLHLLLEPKGSGTRLKLTDTRSGRVGEGESNSTRDGWRVLFEDGLKAHVERDA